MHLFGVRNMKKFLGFALIGLLVAGLFVSCSSDVEETTSYDLCSVDFDANSKGLQVTVDGNLATSGSDEFFWSYKATKLDSYGKEGEKTSITKFYNDTTTKGLAKLENLSTGKWKFELYAFLDGAHLKQVYDGSIEVVLNADVENAIAVPMKRSQVSGQKGKLVIDPTKVNIAYDSGTVVVTNEDSGESYVDSCADRTLFGKLSDYSYCVYKSDENWMTFTTLTDASDKEVCTDVYSADFEPGTYYIEIKLSEKGKNEANTYIAMLVVEIYSNCTTEILDDGSGDNSGIVVKRLKEFKITYYEGKDTTIGYATDEKREVGVHPESKGTHSNVESDFTPEGEDVYPQYHQYGRSELLDVPTRPEYGFAGWYMNFECTGSPVRLVEAFCSEDIILYAKWGELKYSAITWDDNFPASYKGLSYDGKSLTTTGNAAKVAHVGGSTACTITQIKDSLDVAKSPENPVCPGYMFKGWYYDDASLRSPEMTASKSLLPEPKAQIDKRAYKALWEPMKYTIVFHLNSSTSGYCPDDAVFGAAIPGVVYSGTTYANKTATINAEYGLADVFNDASSTKKGFLGWSLDQNATTTAKCVDNENILNLWNNTSTQPTNNATINLYAVWSDWFVPVEYVRSYGATQYINTGLSVQNSETIKFTMEWSGSKRLDGEMVFGTDNYWFGARYRGSDYEWHSNLNGGWNPTGCYFLEDQKYDCVITNTPSRASITVKESGSSDYPVTVNDVARTLTHTTPYCVFAAYRTSAPAIEEWLPADMRLYSLNFYDANGKLVHRFVPCRLLKTMNASTGLATYCQDSTVTSHAGDNTAGAGKGEYGLWDCIGNKFYYNKGTGAFIGPDDEVKVVFKSNYTGSEHTDRVQKIRYNTAEKLHKNVFSYKGRSFQAWNTNAGGTGTDIYDGDPVTYTAASTTLYAKWSGITSWSLFGKVDYIQSHDYAWGVAGECIDSGLAFGTFGGSYRITLDTQFLNLKSPNDIAMEYRTMIGCYTNRTPSTTPDSGDFYAQGLIQRVITDYAGGYAWGCHWRLYDDTPASGHEAVGITSMPNYAAPDTNRVKIIMQTQAGVGSKFGYYQGANLDTAVAEYTNESTLSISSKYKATLYIFAMHNEHWLYEFGSANPRGFSDKSGSKYSNCAYGRVYDMTVDNLAGVIKAHFIPCVLKVDLNRTTKVKDGSGVEVYGNTKVYGGYDCAAGEAGLWDIVNDRFHPNIGAGSFTYPTTQYLIRYDANGGLGSTKEQTVAKSTASFTLSKNQFSFPGYEFMGWNTMPDGSGTYYSDERRLYSSEYTNVTLFAQWRKVEKPVDYTQLEYIQNEGTGANKLAYIDTKIGSTAKYRIIYDFMSLDNIVSDAFGVGPNWSGVVNAKLYIGTTSYTITNTTGTNYKVDVQNFSKLAYSMTPAGASANNVTYSGTHTTGKNYYLFGINENGTLRQINGGRSRMYGAKIYNDKDKLVGDFIPVMLNEDIAASSDSQGVARKKNTLGMWDKVSKKFFANANSMGSFSNGDIVTIHFDKNGGTAGTMEDQVFVVSTDKVALNACVFTNGTGTTAKKFVGWNTRADGRGIWYYDKYETNAWKAGFVTLYAQWSEANKISTEYFETVNYVEAKANSHAYLDLGTGLDEAFLDIRFFNFVTPATGSGFVFGYDDYPGTSGNVHRVNGNIRRGSDMNVSMNVGSSGAWSDKYSSNTTLQGTEFIRFKVGGGSAGAYFSESGAYTVITTYSGDFRPSMGTFLIFASNRCGEYNDNAPARNGFTCGVVEMYNSSGVLIHQFIPCRLIKKIGAYEAGNMAASQQTFKMGTVGYWDFVTNKFYGSTGAGDFNCELN